MALPADLDPLSSCIVIAKHTIYPDDKSPGPVRRGPRRVIEYDVLAEKQGMQVVAYRGPDGAIQYVGGSNTPNTTVLSYEHIAPTRPDPEAKRTARVTHREHIPAQRETVIDDDGTERVVVGRVGGGY